MWAKRATLRQPPLMHMRQPNRETTMTLKSETFEIVGDQKLHCEACENRVARLVKGIPGVVRVRAQASNQRVDVQFDADVLSPTSIADRLTQAGYETRLEPAVTGPTT